MSKFILCFLFILSTTSFTQVKLEKKLSGEYSPDEIISISQTAPFNRAIQMLSSISEKITGKKIYSSVESEEPIGVEVRRMPYLDALNLIVNAKNLMYDERETSIVIHKKESPKETKLEEQESDDIYADLTAREVSISAVFFEADVDKTRELGIDWKLILSKGNVTLGGDLVTKSAPPIQQQQQQGIQSHGNITAASTFTSGSWSGDVTALFRLFDEDNLGEIIASPSISVRNRQKGRIQIGSDFSIKQRDFSGNIIDKFYSAGSIIEVTPYVYNKKGIDYVLLKLNVERSSFFPSELTTEVKKTAASSDVLLLNGEETIIGGLYINEENYVRNGIPFLKDLPWWVLGIRYLTGSEQRVIRKKEVVIVLKADILPTLEQRFSDKTEKDLIRNKLMEDQSDIYKYRAGYKELKEKQ